LAQLPQWQPLDGVPVPDGAGAGRIVAVVASEGAVDGGWAGSATLDLARSWSAAGEKIIVADGALHYPTLHAQVDVENTEGLSDAALFGVSIGRIARPIDGGSFYLITAGTAVADANAVPGSQRWGRLLDGFLEAGVKLILFVRDGDSGCAAFLGSASDIVVLSGRDEKAPAAVRDLEGLVRAVTGRGGVVAQGGVARPPEEWTAKHPSGQRRVVMLVVAVLVVIVLLVVLFILLRPSGAAEVPTGAAASLLPLGLGLRIE